MSKRNYDHLRFRVNEDRRLSDLIRRFPGPEPNEGNPFGANSPEGTAWFDAQDARTERRTCSNGNCTLMWDPRRKQPAYSFGPAACCDE